jgi:RNA polymerase sigma-32 factor
VNKEDTAIDEQLLEELAPETDKAEKPGAANTALVYYDPFQQYLSKIRRFPSLSKEEEFRLAMQYKQEGDLEAAHRLITSHLQLVVKIAFLYKKVYYHIMDLVQEGNIGLLQALKHFNPSMDVRFSTYASWWIRAYILKFILDNWRLVKVGTTNARRKLLYNLEKEKKRLESQGFNYAPKLLAERLEVKEEDVIEVDKSLSATDVSLDSPVDDQEKRTYADTFSSPELSMDEKLVDKEFEELFRDKIHKFAQKLEEKDRYILEHRLVAENPVTLQEIGDQFGITREAVRQKEKKLLRKLRAYLKKELPDYIDVQYLDREDS